MSGTSKPTSVPLTAEEAAWDIENALDILRRNLDLDSIDYGDASDEIRSAVQHVEVALRILRAPDE